jgi:uncharacterized protein YjdB
LEQFGELLGYKLLINLKQMKNFSKSLFMLTTCLIGFSNMQAQTYSGNCGADGDNVQWAFSPSDGKLTIWGTGPMADGSEAWYDFEVVTVDIRDGVTTVGESAFADMPSITSVSIPASVTYINSEAFECENLTSVTCESEVPPGLGDWVFDYIPSNATLHVPDVSIQAYRESDWGSYFTYINVVPVTSVSVSPATANLTVGGTATLTATVNPSNATNKSVTWSSDNATVATVTSAGLVIAVGAGEATITVRTADGGQTADCQVTVGASEVPIYSGYCGAEGNEANVQWEFSPSDGKLTISGTGPMGEAWIFWHQFEVVTVDIRDGVTTIGERAFSDMPSITTVSIPASVTYINSEVFDYCENLTSVTCLSEVPPGLGDWVFTDIPSNATLHVPDVSIQAYRESDWGSYFTYINVVPVTSVSVTPATANLTVDGSTTLTATVLPGNATNKSVTWSVSPTGIVNLTPDGANNSTCTVNAVGAGTATITVTTADGDKTAICQVTVSEDVPRIIRQSLVRMVVGANVILEAEEHVSWRSSNPAVAEVVSTGSLTAKLTARSVGEAWIIVTTLDGNHTDSCKVTVNLFTDIPSAAELVEARVYSDGKNLYIDSPVAERIAVYSLTGALLYSFEKPAGVASTASAASTASTGSATGSATGILIVKGSSGWVKKVIN